MKIVIFDFFFQFPLFKTEEAEIIQSSGDFCLFVCLLITVAALFWISVISVHLFWNAVLKVNHGILGETFALQRDFFLCFTYKIYANKSQTELFQITLTVLTSSKGDAKES